MISRTSDFAADFRAMVADAGFPCVGAKSAVAHNTLNIYLARDIASGWNDIEILEKLAGFSASYSGDPGSLRSFVVIFQADSMQTEKQFETCLWERLQSLADKDDWIGYPHDPDVSADPSDPHFSLSIAGEGYFIIGMHPHASRPARRFARPALVFNLHAQFVALRERGVYQSMRETICQRDRELAGSVNPMLADHGEISEARQYSGRRVGPGWQAPFHRNGSHRTRAPDG